MSEEISENLQKCLEAYRTLSKKDRNIFFLQVQEDELNEIRNKPVEPQEVANAAADFKSLTLKVKSAWHKNQINTYKIIKKKSGWEYIHKDNHQENTPITCIVDGAAESMIKQIFEFGVLNWEKVPFWNNFYTDLGIWTLDISFKNRPKLHLKYDGDFPDKWIEFTNLIIDED